MYSPNSWAEGDWLCFLGPQATRAARVAAKNKILRICITFKTGDKSLHGIQKTGSGTGDIQSHEAFPGRSVDGALAQGELDFVLQVLSETPAEASHIR